MTAGSTEEVKVLGTVPSPFVVRSRIALNLKGVGYEFLELEVEEVYGIKSDLLLKYNPVYKKIPVLIHNGKPICESMIIVEYIDEAWADGNLAILPTDPYDRAIARFWAYYIDDKLFSSIKGIALAAAQTEEAKAEEVSQMFAGLQLLEEAFKNCSKGKGFFGGDTIGYLDIALGSYLSWIEVTERKSGTKFLDEKKTPLLVGWAERFCAEAAVKEVMPEIEKLMEFAKVRREFAIVRREFATVLHAKLQAPAPVK